MIAARAATRADFDADELPGFYVELFLTVERPLVESARAQGLAPGGALALFFAEFVERSRLRHDGVCLSV